MKSIKIILSAALLLTTVNLSAKVGQKLVIGKKAPSVISTYYTAKAKSVAKVKSSLKANGFRVLAVTRPVKGVSVITITNKQLRATNSFLATINVSVNSKEVRVQNPSYFGAAYLGSKFKFGQFKNTLKSLQKALGTLSEVKDEIAFSKLAKYQFMMGMAYYDDTIEVGEGAKIAKKLKKNKNIAYSLKLPNGSILVGHNLKGATNNFLKKINATDNAAILPYRSLIKGGKAVMLDPKYYLAVSLPLLSMGEFMKISSVPGKIEDDIEQAYK